MNESTEKLKAYYDRCIQNYRSWWHLEECQAIHAGYWDETTQNLSQALIKENEVLADIAKINATDHVLDVGCGVGGSALFLASKIGCKVVGIDISESLVQEARANAQHIKSKVEFCVMDYNEMKFSNESFDVVWLLESLCHAFDKEKLIKRISSILSNKGRLIIADGFCEIENQEMRAKAKEYFGSSLYAQKSNFSKILKDTGFKNIEYKNITKHVLPSARRLFYLSFFLVLWSKLGEQFGWSTKIRTDDFKGYFYQYYPLKKGLFTYNIVYAEKS